MLRVAHKTVDSVVIGGGPAGIAVLGHLLGAQGHQHENHLWADPQFRAGRVNARYRKVPSNTNVELFVKFATTLAPFRRIVDSASMPNAFTALTKLPQNQGCALGKAADLLLMLTDGLQTRNDVQCHRGRVMSADLDESSGSWTVQLDGKDAVQTRRLILCTGSSPIEALWPTLSSCSPNMTSIHLDTALDPELLAATVSPDEQTTIGVIGSSHSAVLVLMNLFNLASTTHPSIKVKWFTRHKSLRYAESKGDWILRDNTGLKGEAAEWARRNLDEQAFASSPVSRIITKFWTSSTGEEQVFRAQMPACTHVVQALGYRPDPLPRLTVNKDNELVSPEHDGLTGRFFAARGPSQHVPGLFGAGIAFPECVTDPLGNQEYAVGFWKFMRFCDRVVPSWLESHTSV